MLRIPEEERCLANVVCAPTAVGNASTVQRSFAIKVLTCLDFLYQT
jgi:hypothetical protein